MAEPTQVLQSETGGIDRQTYSLFRESSSVALQASTDLTRLKLVTMVRRFAVQEHSAAHVQLASCISAIMKFGAGADDDPFVKVKVQTASASQEQTSCMNLTMRVDRIVAAVLISSPMAARLFFYHDAVSSIWRVGCVCVLVCVGVCLLWCGTLKTSVCAFNTSPCVRSKCPRVYRQHAHMFYTCGHVAVEVSKSA